MMHWHKSVALFFVSLLPSPALAQDDVLFPLDDAEAQILLEQPNPRLLGSTEQREAARVLMTALPAGTMLRTRGGLAGENRHVRILAGDARLDTWVRHPCAIAWPADYLDFPPAPAVGSTLNFWTFEAPSITRVSSFSRSVIVIQQPFELGGGFAFLTFADDSQADQALAALDGWVRACRSGSEATEAAHRIEAAITAAFLKESDLNRRPGEPIRQVVAMLSDFDRIACGQPLWLYSVPFLSTGVGSLQYERADEHKPIRLDDLRDVKIGETGNEGEVSLFPAGRRQPLVFSFLGPESAGKAAAFAGDLELFARHCRI